MVRLSHVLLVILGSLLVCCGLAPRPLPRPVVEAVRPFPATEDAVARSRQRMMASTVEVAFLAKKDADGSDFTSFGAGFVFFVDGKRSLVMTNRHVCVEDETHDAVLTATGMDGELHPAIIIYADPGRDTCVLLVDGVPGLAVAFAAAEPPLGADVVRVGNDFAAMGRMTAILGSGVFSGRMAIAKEPRCLFSMVTATGGSGGPIFYRGEVVGMVEAIKTVPRAGELSSNITLGICLSDIQDTVVRSFEQIIKVVRKGESLDARPDAP